MDYVKDYKKMAQQMTSVYRAAMDNSINALNMVQENTEKVVKLSLDQSPWLPEEGTKLVNSWMTTYKKGYDDFKVAADEQYRKMEALISLQTKG